MYDNMVAAPIGTQIRKLRIEAGWSLAELADRVGTSPPTMHRYETGYGRFELATLRRIARALDAELHVRFRSSHRAPPPDLDAGELVDLLAPLFWDKDLDEADLQSYEGWVVERVLSYGTRKQVDAVRTYVGGDAVRRAVDRPGVDARTRHYWQWLLEDQ